MKARKDGHLPRLGPAWYRGRAFVLWTHTVERRGKGWLDPSSHQVFRELLLHAAVREALLCPVYTMMPDHVHLVWLGISENSDQRLAAGFLRTKFEPRLAPHAWQHQPHDSVLREKDRERGAFTSACAYVAENPVRAGLVDEAKAWPYVGCVVPGYPDMEPWGEKYWDLFWRIYYACLERGAVGKI